MNEIVSKAIETVKQILRETGEHSPMCFYFRDNEMLGVVQYFIEEGIPKEQLWASLAAKGVMEGANQYMLIHEAWMSTVKTEEEVYARRPSDDPNRVECVVISFIDKEKNKDIMASIPFVKNNLGMEIKEPQVLENQYMGGVMGEIFHKAVSLLKKLETGGTTMRQLRQESYKQSTGLTPPPQLPELN